MFSLRSAIVDNLITMSCKLNRKPFGLRPLSSAEASLCESEAGKKKKAHGERWEGETLVIVSAFHYERSRVQTDTKSHHVNGER